MNMIKQIDWKFAKGMAFTIAALFAMYGAWSFTLDVDGYMQYKITKSPVSNVTYLQK